MSEAILTGANLAGADFSSTITSESTNFSHTYLAGARFYCLGGEKFAYLGCFHGAIFAAGEKRIEAANADFSQISDLVDDQFACYYKSEIVLPLRVSCRSTNRFTEARDAAPASPSVATSTVSAAAWEDGYTD